MFDPVNRPSHYAEGREHEPIDVIEDWELNYHLGNALKYISRAGRKSNNVAQDISKAIWYLERYKDQLQPRRSADDLPFLGTVSFGPDDVIYDEILKAAEEDLDLAPSSVENYF